MIDTMIVSKSFHTDGMGLWSDEKRKVFINSIRVCFDEDDPDYEFGELRVIFDPEDWDIKEYGLIYTDPKFLKELKEWLVSVGLSSKVDYSEQGMQGIDYVSLDYYGNFINKWKEKFK